MRKLGMMVTSAMLLSVATSLNAFAQDKDIVETAVAAGTFKTLTKALNDAGLTETLKGPGPFTVFAPTDAAFAKMPADKLAALLKDRSALKQLLLYHVVAGKVMAAEIAKLNGKSTKTVEGGEAKVMMMGTSVMVNNAHVTSPDILARNGVIHVIDTVLMPNPN